MAIATTPEPDHAFSTNSIWSFVVEEKITFHAALHSLVDAERMRSSSPNMIGLARRCTCVRVAVRVCVCVCVCVSGHLLILACTPHTLTHTIHGRNDDYFFKAEVAF